jgi:RES domain-containing protein
MKMVKEHRDYPTLLAAMKVAVRHFRPWSGIIFRSAPPKWAAGRNLLSGIGSMKAGARFNAFGTFPALYGSTTPELAMIESLAYQRRAGLPVQHAMPLVFKAISVVVERLLDLNDPFVLDDLGVNIAQLRREAWWLARARNEESRTQAIGRAAHACRVQALLASSAHASDHGLNLVILTDHLTASANLQVLRHP